MTRGLEARLARAVEAVEIAIRRSMEEAAEDLVQFMKQLAPVKEGDLRKSIGWTWGDAPEGSVSVDTVTSSGVQITIYAGRGLDFPARARWVEFGTAPHSVAKGGGTAAGKALFAAGGGKPHPGAKAHPYFYPAYRAKKAGIIRRMRREIKAELKRV
jgi:hypothetical protein